jgi:hypothetical protein
LPAPAVNQRRVERHHGSPAFRIAYPCTCKHLGGGGVSTRWLVHGKSGFVAHGLDPLPFSEPWLHGSRPGCHLRTEDPRTDTLASWFTICSGPAPVGVLLP